MGQVLTVGAVTPKPGPVKVVVGRLLLLRQGGGQRLAVGKGGHRLLSFFNAAKAQAMRRG
jgi:hypothetical protein